MNPPIVYEYVVHLEIGILAGLRIVKLDEGVLERVARLTVANDFAAVIKSSFSY